MIKPQMERQLTVLRDLDGLLTRADTEEQTGTATAEDIEHLRKYISDMRRACNTAIALETALKKAEAPTKRKTRAKKADTPAPEPDKAEATIPEPDKADKTAAPVPEPETPAEPEDNDLSFLD